MMKNQEKLSKKEVVILIGTDTPIGLSIIQDLGRHNYITIGVGHSETAIAGYSKHCSHHIKREQNEADLICQIKALAVEFNASYLLAISENDLLLLNRNRSDLETLVTLLIPEAESLNKVLDKKICQEHAEFVGIRTPKSWHFSSIEDVREKSHKLPYPVVLKWSDANSVAPLLRSKGIDVIKTAYAKTASELIELLTPYLAINQFPMAQEYCPGHGLGQFFLVKNGEVIIEFQHERIHEWPPEGGTSSLCKTVALTAHKEIQNKSRALLKYLNWNGVAMVEYRYDLKNDIYYFMEINGRFWGSLPLALSAGIPFASSLISVCGKEGDVPDFNREYDDLTACYWIPETKRLFRLLFQKNMIEDPFYKPDPWRSLLIYLTLPFRLSTRYYIFQPSDPKPFFGDVSNVIKKIINMIIRR